MKVHVLDWHKIKVGSANSDLMENDMPSTNRRIDRRWTKVLGWIS
jgi:hypothetical protein